MPSLSSCQEASYHGAAGSTAKVNKVFYAFSIPIPHTNFLWLSVSVFGLHLSLLYSREKQGSGFSLLTKIMMLSTLNFGPFHSKMIHTFLLLLLFGVVVNNPMHFNFHKLKSA